MRAAALILCAAAFLAGCGGDDDEAETTTVIETTSVPTTIETVPTPGKPDVTTPDETGGAEAPSGENGNGAVQAPSHCGRIAFNKATDSGAAGITAVGTDCDTARTVARAARNATDELSYEADSFRCAGTHSEKAGLASIEWFCVGADREVVSFVTT
jgi:hypothetical protein